MLNKVDAIDPKDIEEYRAEFAQSRIELFAMSAATGEGIAPVLEKVWSILVETR